MYKPSSVYGLPTTWVPLQKYEWSWGATANQRKEVDENNQDVWTNIWDLTNILGASPTVSKQNTTEFPHWTMKH